jgi:hypothetical protein
MSQNLQCGYCPAGASRCPHGKAATKTGVGPDIRASSLTPVLTNYQGTPSPSGLQPLNRQQVMSGPGKPMLPVTTQPPRPWDPADETPVRPSSPTKYTSTDPRFANTGSQYDMPGEQQSFGTHPSGHSLRQEEDYGGPMLPDEDPVLRSRIADSPLHMGKCPLCRKWLLNSHLAGPQLLSLFR